MNINFTTKLNLNKMDLVYKAEKYAKKVHSDVNHEYGTYPYEYHLSMVVDEVNRFIHLIPREERTYVLAAAWLHDSIEDARVTYNDIKKEFGEIVAEYVYALTNEKGRNRAERANGKYYKGIQEYRECALVKICDRIANAKHSLLKGSSMYDKYKKEQMNFRMNLEDGRFKEAWSYLEKIY